MFKYHLGWSSIATTIVIPIYYVPALGRCQSPLAKQLSNSLSLSKYFSGNPIFSSLTVDLEVPVYFSRRAVEISQSDKSNQRFLRKYGGGIHSRRTMKSLSYIGVGIAWHKLTTLWDLKSNIKPKQDRKWPLIYLRIFSKKW